MNFKGDSCRYLIQMQPFFYFIFIYIYIKKKCVARFNMFPSVTARSEFSIRLVQLQWVHCGG